jgi:hypothetical protein
VLQGGLRGRREECIDVLPDVGWHTIHRSRSTQQTVAAAISRLEQADERSELYARHLMMMRKTKVEEDRWRKRLDPSQG